MRLMNSSKNKSNIKFKKKKKKTGFLSQCQTHTKREGNKVAHSLARYVLHISSFVVWMEHVPQQVYPVLQADLANFY